MAKRIIHQKPDGTVAIIIPAPNAMKEHGFTTEQEHIDYLIARLIPQGESSFVIEDTEVPTRRFRNAWEWNGSQIAVNKTKAISIRAQELEEVRNKKLEQLSKEAQKNDDDGNASALAQSKTKRKQVRDLNLTDELTPLTIEQIADHIPEVFQ